MLILQVHLLEMYNVQGISITISNYSDFDLVWMSQYKEMVIYEDQYGKSIGQKSN